VPLLSPDQPEWATLTLAEEPGGGVVRRTVLPGGLRVVTEAVPAVRSVSIGVWAGVGSRDELIQQAGASHFLEHLLFKGTQRREAFDISAAIESGGGELNAFTGKESTCFYARVLDTDLPLAVDVLMDLVLSSLIREPDFAAERDVILEEIAMHLDEPSDAVHDGFAAALYGSEPLGRPILGTVDSIGSMSRDTVADYYRARYALPNLVVAVAGSLEHDQVVQEVAKALELAGLSASTGRPTPPRIDPVSPLSPAPLLLTPRPVEQAHLVLGVPGVRLTDERRFAVGVLNAVLGGGMSSRLFQEVREKRGLAYSVYSFASQYSDSGMFGVYAGCLPQKVGEVLDVCRGELARVAESGLTATEVEQGRGQLAGSLVLRQEDTGSRMSRLGKSELFHGEWLSLDEVLARVDAVSAADVAAVAADLLKSEASLAVVGPFDSEQEFAAVA
jgi:predicted Zn-dependent peptidase